MNLQQKDPVPQEKISARKNGSRRVQTETPGESRTQQHLHEQTKMSSILARYDRTGQFNHVNVSPGMYGDFTQYQDLRSNIEKVRSAQAQFDQIPAQIRNKFDNDPTRLVEYLSNPSNLDEAESLGFLVRRQEPKKSPNDDKTTKSDAPAPAQS